MEPQHYVSLSGFNLLYTLSCQQETTMGAYEDSHFAGVFKTYSKDSIRSRSMGGELVGVYHDVVRVWGLNCKEMWRIPSARQQRLTV